jgi:hypothetical protein
MGSKARSKCKTVKETIITKMEMMSKKEERKKYV